MDENTGIAVKDQDLNPWEEWFEKKKKEYTVKGVFVPLPLAKMYAWYKRKENSSCDTCAFFSNSRVNHQSRRYCGKFPERGNGHWPADLPGCGLYQPDQQKIDSKNVGVHNSPDAVRGIG